MSSQEDIPAERNPSLADRLGLLQFDVDTQPFITVDTNTCRSCEKKPCLYVCPASVYRLENSELVYNTEGCVEMGVCQMVCHSIGKAAIKWNYPRGGKGVTFKFG